MSFSPTADYTLRTSVRRAEKEVLALASKPFRGGDVQDGRISFATAWKPERLWDLNTPGNVYAVNVSLLDRAGRVLDTAWEERFVFRELWIQGRDFYLNGTRLVLSAVPIDNAVISAGQASYEATRETLRALQELRHQHGLHP